MTLISNIGVVLAVTCACAVVTAQENGFKSERVVRIGKFTIAASPDRVFPLFTPLGEKHWARGWNPEVFYPADGHPVKGLLFRTDDHGGMYWWLTRYEPEKYTVEYHAIVAAGFGRNIRVECKQAGKGTEVVVTDAYIGLSEHGNEFIRSLDEEAYQKKMKGWEEPISRYLKTGEDPK